MKASEKRKVARARIVGALVGGGGAVAVIACGTASGDHDGPTAGERLDRVTAAITRSSCQALDVAAFDRTAYAIKLDGELVGWGRNAAEQNFPLGSNNPGLGLTVTSPQALGVKNAKQVVAYQNGACALVEGGTVTCLGVRLGASPLGQGVVPPPPSPVHVAAGDAQGPLLTGVVGLAAGDAHACAWKADGTAWCWGSNSTGQLAAGADPSGTGVKMGFPNAVQVVGVTDVAAVAASGSDTCVLHRTGVVACAGNNRNGALGQGAPTATLPDGGIWPQGTLVPVYAPGVRFHALYGGGHGTFCATGTPVPGAPPGTTETTYCWGKNDKGQAVPAQAPAAINLPTAVSNDAGAVWALGPGNACEMTAAGALSCWGVSSQGQVPGGVAAATTNAVLTPTAISGVSGVYKVAIGEGFLCALANTALTCWGSNSDGQIGNGSAGGDAAPSPLRLSTPPASCTDASSCAAVTNACGETAKCDCGGRLASGDQVCGASNACHDNPSYCGAAGCTVGGEVCSNRQCLAQCTLVDFSNPTYGADLVDGQTITVPAGYGAPGCDGFAARTFKLGWGSGYASIKMTDLTQDNCPNTRVSWEIYEDGHLTSTQAPIYGLWHVAAPQPPPPPGTIFPGPADVTGCYFAVNQGTLPYTAPNQVGINIDLHTAPDKSIWVIKAERSLPNKSTPVWAQTGFQVVESFTPAPH